MLRRSGARERWGSTACNVRSSRWRADHSCHSRENKGHSVNALHVADRASRVVGGSAPPRRVPSAPRRTALLRSLPSSVLLLLALGATVAVYHAVPGIYFFADDFVCQLQIVERGLLGFLMSPFGGHTLVVRNLVFWVWYLAFGFRPEPYHWALLVTHLINVWLLFRVIRALPDDPAIACLGA